MEIIIQSPGFKASESLLSFIHEKMEKLDHLSNNIIRADLSLVLSNDAGPEKKICDIRLEIPGNDLFVKKYGDSFEAAVMEAIDALQMQMRRHKEKELGKRHS